MDRKTRIKMEARVKIIKALAHPTRLYIADQVCCRERTVGQLTEMIGVDMSTISRHLSILKHAGIIKVRKDGLQVYCSLAIPCIMNFFNCAEDAVREVDKSLAKSSEQTKK